MLSTLRTMLIAAACLAATLALTVAPASSATASTTAAPEGFHVTATGFEQISVAWSRVPGAEFYGVLVDGVWRSGAYDPASSTTITQLRPGTSYTLEVRAQAADGTFGPGATLRASTHADTQPPSPPPGLRVTADASGLTWDTPTDNWGVSETYRLFADDRLVLIGGRPATWSRLTDPYFGGLICGATHTFTVQAWDNAHNLSAHSAPLRTTIPPC